MASALKQVLVLGGLVAGAFGVATLLNGRRKKRRARREVELEDDLPGELDEVQPTARSTEVSP